MKDMIALLVEANERESAGDSLGAIALCEQALDGTELPDHYFTLARNYFSLAHQGNEIYAWKALLAAVEGIDRRAKEQGQSDAEFAVGIMRWVLDHFADWHRLDVTSSHLHASLMDEQKGLEPGTTMDSIFYDFQQRLETNDPMILANRLYREAPLIVRPGRTRSGIERESRYALANQFSQVQDSDVGQYLDGMGLPVPGDFNYQTYEKYLFTASRVELMRLQARVRGIPAIMLTCLPKSASEFLSYTIADVLEAPVVRGTIGGPMRGVLVEEWVKEIVRGGCVLHDHFFGRKENIAVLQECGVEKLYVLVRDPRAVLFSMHNMGDELGIYEANVDLFPELNSRLNYFSRDVQILSQWIESWIAARENGLGVQFITFNELVTSPMETMTNVLERSGASGYIEKLSETLTKKGKGNNFRRGDDDAWRAHIPDCTAAEAWANIAPSVRSLLGLKP